MISMDHVHDFLQAFHSEADALHVRAPLPLQHYTRLVLGLGIARKAWAQVERNPNPTYPHPYLAPPLPLANKARHGVSIRLEPLRVATGTVYELVGTGI